MRYTVGAIALAVALGGTVTAAQAPPDPKLADQGRRLYASYKCDQCHMINGRGSKKGPLDGVATKLTPAELRQWLTNPAEMEAKMDKPPQGTNSMANALKKKAIEPAEVDALVAYMRTLTRR